MNLFKKIVVIYYMVIVSLALLAAYQNTAAISNIVTIFSIAIVPVALSAIRTSDFWHDDPNSVARLKKEYLEAIANKDAAIAQIETGHIDVMTQKNTAHAAEIRKMQAEYVRSVQNRKVTQVLPNISASGSARTQEKAP